MTKKITLIASLLLITACLAVGIIYLNNQSNDAENEPNPHLVILSLDENEIDSLEIQNEHGDYTASFYDDATAKHQLKVDMYKDLPSQASSCKNLLNNVTSLVAMRNFGEASNRAKYGLDTPFATLIVNLTDGGQKIVTFGNQSPDKSGRYAALSGDGNIYIVKDSIANIFSQSVDNFLSLNLFGIYTDNDAMSVNQIILGGNCREDAIVISNQKDEHTARIFKILSPKESYAKDENVAEFCTMLTLTYSAEGVEVLNPTDKELSDYGFDNPYSTVKFIFDDKEEYIVFGKEAKDGKLFATVNNIPAIYRLNAEDYPFIAYNLTALSDSALFSCIISYVEQFSITKSNATDTVILTDSSSQLNGKDFDYDAFKNYYTKFLLSLSHSSEKSCSKSAQRLAEVNISFAYDRADENFIFYSEAGEYFVSVNQKPAVKIDADKTEDFLSQALK